MTKEPEFSVGVSYDASYDPKRAPRYAEISTFMRAPLDYELEAVDIALCGVPYDGGVSNRPGARHGPREIRNQSSLMRPVHHVFNFSPHELARVADVGDVRFAGSLVPEKAEQEIQQFFERIHAAGAIPLAAGGDHSITLPIFRAIAKERPIGMVHIDAHTDTWGEIQGSKFNHGSPFRSAVEEKLLDPKRTIQIGIRGAQYSDDAIRFSLDNGMRVIFIEEFDELGIKQVISEARRVVGDGPTYISFDVDGLDPVFAPGTGTPEAGGITMREAQQFLRGLRGLDLIGGDVVEVAPPFDQTGNTALVGATLMYEILCLLADANRKNKQ